MNKYRTILVDPPWSYEAMGKRHAGRSPRKLPSDYYSCMTMEDLISLPVKQLSDESSHMYMWVTNAFVEEGHQLMKAWGYSPKTMITWVKDRMGVGWYFRGQTEHMIFGVKGSCPVNVKNIPTFFVANRLRHSQKPEKSFEIIEKASNHPYLELFARNKRTGWDVWGNEVESDIDLIINQNKNAHTRRLDYPSTQKERNY